MNYQKIYDNLILKRQINVLHKMHRNAENYQYCETHHIIPKCLGGSDDKPNLVNLTAREHFIAHMLLSKCYPKNFKLAMAVHYMLIFSTFNPRNILSNSKKYDYVRSHISRVKAEHQKNLRWIKNTITGQTSFWPKGTQLSKEMIDSGWKFGRFSIDCHKNRTYENAGYQAGIYIRITNEIEDKYILKTDVIPNGWHRGMSKKNRQHQSNACKGRKGTTTGRKCIVNDATGQSKFIMPTDELPKGWRYGTVLKGRHRPIEFSKKLSKILKGRKVSDATRQRISEIGKCYRWYTNGQTNIRIRYDAEIPNGFYRGRKHNNARNNSQK